MKRILSLIMAMAMVLSLVPAVYAETTAEPVIIASGTDVEATVAKPIEHIWTAESDGVLTVTMGAASPGWRFTIYDASGNTIGLPKSGKTEKVNEFDLVGGTTYRFVATGWSSSAWEETTAVFSYSLAFLGASGEEEIVLADYEISDTDIVLGDNTVSLLETAITTIFIFEPAETGVYTFTAPANAILGYWGAGSWFLTNPNSTTNTYEWTCTGVGQTAYIGISGVSGNFNLNIEKTGDYTVVEIPIVPYENKATLETFVLPENAQLHGYIDVAAETVHTAVLGDDGYYHLNSADGDVILVDMDYQDIILSNALKSDRPVMYAYVTDEDGNTIKYDIGNAILAYEAVMDENGYYPLTEDLILFYDTYAMGAGTYTYYVSGAYNEENIWMYCMRTVTLPDEPETTEPEVTEPEVTEPEATEPEVTEPEATEPEVTEPEVTEPEVTEPEETQPTKPTPDENVFFTVVTANSTSHHKYATEITSAIANVTGSATVTLYKDINLSGSAITIAAGQNITLDLNGCTLTTSKSSSGVVNVSGVLTVQDTSAEQDGLISNTNTSSDRGILITATGYVIFESGAISTKTQGIRVEDGKLLMTGGTINATQYGIFGGGTSNVTISGGTINVNTGTFYHSVYGGGSATMSITGGYFGGGALKCSGLIESISGGYFVTAPDASTIAADCEIQEIDDAVYKYTVVDPNAVVEPEEPVLGSEENPVLIYNMGANFDAAAGQTVYCHSFVGGMIMNIAGADNFTVIYNGVEYVSENGTLSTTEISGARMNPAVFTIVNGDSDATYTITFAAPIGNMENPDTLVMDYNYANVAAGSQGYYYTWTADEAGILTITMPEDMEWTYTINNLTTGIYGDIHMSDDAEVANPATIEVAAGDQLQIIVNSYNPDDMWGNPAAELALYVSFNTLPGTQNNPIMFQDLNTETSAIEDQLSVPAGATLYYTGRVGGLTMTVSAENISIAYNGNVYTPVNGVITINVVNAGFFAPAPVFAVTNTGSENAVYDVVFNYPEGSFENPAVLAMGENSANITGAGQGYYFTWTAAEDGKLTIEMTSSNWTYVINNNTQYGYGDNHTSNDTNMIAKETVSVTAGDEIQIVIGTADYEAATVTLNASFKNNTVAEIDGTGYKTISDALLAAKDGDTIILVNDAEADYVVLIPGVTLDLASYTLTANYVIGLKGSYITAEAEGATEGVAGGKLVVDKNNISLSSAAVSADNNWKMLPVWMDGYFAFAKAQIYNPVFTANADDSSATLTCVPTFNKYFKENVFDNGCEDNLVSVIIEAVYFKNGVKVTQEFYYTTPLIKLAMQNFAIHAEVAGCDAFTDLQFSISIVSSTGVEISSQIYNYNDYVS